MLATLLIPLALNVAHPGVPPTAVARASDPPVKVWLSSDGDFRYGEKAKVYAKTSQDGYLLVLYADPRGRIRVLYPVDPGASQAVKGGKKIEIRGRGDREAFVATDSGRGLVFGAYSSQPFNFDQYTQNGHWDYRALADSDNDPETRMMDIVHDMQSAGRYTYDVASYVVDSDRYAWRGHRGYPVYGYGPRISVGLGFGRFGRFYDPFYDPFYFGYGPFWYNRTWRRW